MQQPRDSTEFFHNMTSCLLWKRFSSRQWCPATAVSVGPWIYMYLMFRLVCPSEWTCPTSMWEKLEELLANSRKALARPLRRDFLYLLDHLQALTTDSNAQHAATLTNWWKSLGDMTGISEAVLRKEYRDECLKSLDGQERAGCSWFKCPVFEWERDELRMLRCQGCRKAMYCGLVCQRR